MVSSSRRALACILFLVAAAFFANAQQDQTGSISGKVTFKNKGVASILVIAIDTNYGDGEERSGSQAYVPPDAKNDKALKTALSLVRGTVSAKAKIDRRDFGLTWNQALETGGFVVGDEIRIAVDVEFTAQAE